MRSLLSSVVEVRVWVHGHVFVLRCSVYPQNACGRQDRRKGPAKGLAALGNQGAGVRAGGREEDRPEDQQEGDLAWLSACLMVTPFCRRSRGQRLLVPFACVCYMPCFRSHIAHRHRFQNNPRAAPTMRRATWPCHGKQAKI